MKPKSLLTGSMVALLVVGINLSVYAQEKKYPNKAIQILVPYAPGTGMDLFMRLVAEQVKKDWKVPVNIINNAAAGGMIAAEEVAHGRKDGYTLLSCLESTLGTMTAANPEGPIHLLRDFTPIFFNYAYNVCMLCVKSDSEFKSLEDVVDYARKNPGKLICSTPVVGTDAYLKFLLFRRQAKINLVHLPFSNMAENINALLGGHSQVAIVTEGPGKPQIEAGRMRALASDIKPLSFPDVPTFIEKGYDHVNLPTNLLILGPKGLPAEVIEAWEKPIKVLSKDPQFISSCHKVGVKVDLRLGTEKLQSMLKEALEKYSKFTPEELGWAKKK